jgi:hypothetical protein
MSETMSGSLAKLRELRRVVQESCPSEQRKDFLRILDELCIELGGDDKIPLLLSKAESVADRSGVTALPRLVEAVRSQIDQDEVEREKKLPSFVGMALLAVSIGFLVGILTIAIFFLLSSGHFFPWVTQEQAERMLHLSGMFGDTFGMVNALISAVAFGGVLYTVYLQRKELSLQREELRAARKEASRSADALNKQVLLSTQSARISGLSNMSQHLNSVLSEQDTPEVREARGRRTWHAEQMQFYLTRLLTGELNVEQREDFNFEEEIMRLHNNVSSSWAEQRPADDAPAPAVYSATRDVLLFLAEHLGSLQYYAHPRSPAFQAIDQLQASIRKLLYNYMQADSMRNFLLQGVDNVLDRLAAVAPLSTSKPDQRP